MASIIRRSALVFVAFAAGFAVVASLDMPTYDDLIQEDRVDASTSHLLENLSEEEGGVRQVGKVSHVVRTVEAPVMHSIFSPEPSMGPIDPIVPPEPSFAPTDPIFTPEPSEGPVVDPVYTPEPTENPITDPVFTAEPTAEVIVVDPIVTPTPYVGKPVGPERPKEMPKDHCRIKHINVEERTAERCCMKYVLCESGYCAKIACEKVYMHFSYEKKLDSLCSTEIF